MLRVQVSTHSQGLVLELHLWVLRVIQTMGAAGKQHYSQLNMPNAHLSLQTACNHPHTQRGLRGDWGFLKHILVSNSTKEWSCCKEDGVWGLFLLCAPNRTAQMASRQAGAGPWQRKPPAYSPVGKSKAEDPRGGSQGRQPMRSHRENFQKGRKGEKTTTTQEKKSRTRDEKTSRLVEPAPSPRRASATGLLLPFP